jgi:hypothetical protein
MLYALMSPTVLKGIARETQNFIAGLLGDQQVLYLLFLSCVYQYIILMILAVFSKGMYP